MNFLSPLMLLGVLGAMIPIIVHLQGRRKAKVIRFAALDFLLGTDKRLAKKLVIRRIALLIARVAICLVIPLILAQPYTSCTKSGPQVTRGPQAAVLIIDNSMASEYSLDGKSLLDRSIESAREVLELLGPEAEVVILTTTKANNDELTRDHLHLRNQLKDIVVSPQRADTRSAFARGLQLLEGSGHERNTVFILAPPTAAVLPKSIQAPTNGSVNVRVISPADADVVFENLAITDLQVETDGNIGDRGVTVIAEVTNFSPKPATAQLALEIGSTVLARGELTLAPGETQKKRFSANLVDKTRTAEISVYLKRDALNSDNRRFVVADARDQLPVLLVNGDPRTVRHEDELYYVEAALRPGDRSDSGTLITSSTPDALGDAKLDAFDVIMLVNVQPLPTDTVSRLQAWVRAGGGLFLSVGDNVDPKTYNKKMAPLLAQELRTALDLRSGRKDDNGKALRLTKIEKTHPIFSVFKKDAPGLYNASFHQIMLLGPTTSASERRVLTRYSNGGAALVETKLGNGKLLLFTSTLDRDWNNLAIHPGFLPFMQSSIRYLAARPFQGQERQVIVGDSVSLKIAQNDTRLEIDGPSDSRYVLEGDKINQRKRARLESLLIPGFYRVQSVDTDDNIHQRPEAAFAVNVDTVSSNLKRIPTDSLETTSNRIDEDVSGHHTRRVELWHGVAASLLFFLMMESILSLYGGRARKRANTPQ